MSYGSVGEGVGVFVGEDVIEGVGVLVGVKYQTFASWRRRRSGPPNDHNKGTPSPRFVEVAAPQSHPALELELPGQVRLRIGERSQLPLVVELLRQLHAC